MPEDVKLATRISKVRWCDPHEGLYTVDAARIPEVMSDKNAKEMYWFDELFNGGITLPAEVNAHRRAITLLITGPPGTGKSTLALELCLRLARSNSKVLVGDTYYVASESYPPWMIKNAISFGWLKESESQTYFKLASETRAVPTAAEGPRPIILYTLPEIARMESGFLGPLRKALGLTSDGPSLSSPEPSQVGLLVVDSLNSVRTEKAEQFEKLYETFVQSGPRLIIFVLDSSPNQPVAETWEFAADIVLRLDRNYGGGYMIRTIEILKARYQSHAWGKHQLKIYEAPKAESLEPETAAHDEHHERRLRAHPWCDGGLFIFPSIHYILSQYKRISPARLHGEAKAVKTPLEALNKLLGGGIPAGRSTAILGGRGSHKSHFGYLQALHNVLAAGGKSLILSLRDDEATTEDTLTGILNTHWPNEARSISALLRSGSLEILYYVPGYITPQEFFHRMLLSIYRMRAGTASCPITLLFNSLDQIASRFPLCAKEEVFIPGIIQILAAIGVTSVFVGADTEGIDKSLRDLLSMAELIIRVKRKISFPKSKLEEILNGNLQDGILLPGGRIKVSSLPDKFPTTELTVERYAGGKPAGSQGILELVSRDSVFNGILPDGLQFMPYRTSEGTDNEIH